MMTGAQKIDGYLHAASVVAVSDQVYLGGMNRMNLMAVLLNAALCELYAHGATLPNIPPQPTVKTKDVDSSLVVGTERDPSSDTSVARIAWDNCEGVWGYKLEELKDDPDAMRKLIEFRDAYERGDRQPEDLSNIPAVQPALALIVAERLRQVRKGWTPDHDDDHKRGELAMAAAACAADGTEAGCEMISGPQPDDEPTDEELDAYERSLAEVKPDFSKPSITEEAGQFLEHLLPSLGQDEDVRLSLLAARTAFRNGNSNGATAILGLVNEVRELRSKLEAVSTVGMRWVIYFFDADVQPEVFAGEGAEEAARRRFADARLSWNCYLLREVESADGSETDTSGPALTLREPSVVTVEHHDVSTVHGVTFILIRRGQVLLERCPKKAKKLGGEWFVPGGKVHAGEHEIDAAIREVREEWGVELIGWNRLPIIEGSVVGLAETETAGPFLMRPFEVLAVSDPIPTHTVDEGVELRWFPISEALSSPVPQVRAMVAMAARQVLAPTKQVPE